MDFQTFQAQINLRLSEMCAAYYNTVHGAWHQAHNVCRYSYPFTKKALVIFVIYRAMT